MHVFFVWKWLEDFQKTWVPQCFFDGITLTFFKPTELMDQGILVAWLLIGSLIGVYMCVGYILLSIQYLYCMNSMLDAKKWIIQNTAVFFWQFLLRDYHMLCFFWKSQHQLAHVENTHRNSRRLNFPEHQQFAKRATKTPYCWWKKSCTTWDVQNPGNNGITTYQLVQDFFHQQYLPYIFQTSKNFGLSQRFSLHCVA